MIPKLAQKRPGGPVLLLIAGVAIVLLLLLTSGAWTQAGRLTGRGAIVWKQTEGPTGGTIFRLLSHPTEANVLYATTETGLYVSRDGANRWRPAGQGLPNFLRISALAIDRTGQLLYAGVEGALYRSQDGGETWSGVSRGHSNLTILSLFIVPTTPLPTVLIGTNAGAFYSPDGGQTWLALGNDLVDLSVNGLAADPVNGQNLYALTSGGFFRSNDGGKSWTAASKGLIASSQLFDLAIHPAFPNILFLATEDGVYRSLDYGNNWTKVGTDKQKGNVLSLAISTQAVYAGSSELGLWYSEDNGVTWVQGGPELVGVPVTTLCVSAQSPSLLFAGTSVNGVYRSTNRGQSWSPANQGLINSTVRGLLSRGERGLLAATASGIQRHDSQKRTWEMVNLGIGANVFVVSLTADPRQPERIYAGTWGAGIYRSEDGGRSWQNISTGLPREYPITALVVSYWTTTGAGKEATLPTLYAAAEGGGIFKSTDQGGNWVAINRGLGSWQVLALAEVPGADGLLLAGTSGGLYRSQDAGKSWQPAGNGLVSGEVREIRIDPQEADSIYVIIAPATLVRSSDRGRTWSDLPRGSLPTNIQFYTLFQDPRAPRLLYLGTDSGVFRSSDGGRTWQAMNDGLPMRSVVSCFSIGPEGVLYAGTLGSGVYRGSEPYPNGSIYAITIIVSLLLIGSVGGSAFILSRGLARLPREETEAALVDHHWPSWDRKVSGLLLKHESITPAMITEAPERLRSTILQRYVAAHPELRIRYRSETQTLETENDAENRAWVHDCELVFTCLDDDTPEGYDTFERQTSRLTDRLCRLLGFGRLHDRSYQSAFGYVVHAPALRLRIPARFPILFLKKRHFSPEDLEDIRSLMSLLEMTGYFALVVVFDGAEELRRLARESAYDLIVLDPVILRQLYLHNDPERALVAQILEQVDLTVVSPYVVSGPVPETMFFGRDYEIKTITRQITERSFALVGGRKIGKTSVLNRVNRILAASRDHYVLPLDCQPVQDYLSLSDNIQVMWHSTLDEPTPTGMYSLFTAIHKNRPDQHLVVLMDEVDHLLNYDRQQDYALFRVLRSLSQEGFVHFVFCGERSLHDAVHDSTSPLFNFCDLLILGYLQSYEVERMVIDPMTEMGLVFEGPEEVVSRILELTSGHPNLVQDVCQRLILRVNHLRQRTIAVHDVEAVRRDSRFQEYFLETVWGASSPRERLITVLMLDQPTFTEAMVMEALVARGLVLNRELVARDLDTLCLRSILSKVEGAYQFQAVSFPAIVRMSQDVELLIESYLVASPC